MTTIRAGAAVIIIALALTAAARGASDQLISLQDFAAQSGIEKDPAALGYIAERCAALYLLFAKNLSTETAPDRLALGRDYQTAAERFFNRAAVLEMKGTTKDAKMAAADAGAVVAGLADLYRARGERQRLLTDNALDDGLLRGDLAVCQKIAQTPGALP